MTAAAEWEDPYADLVRTDDPSPGAARYYALDLGRGEMRRVGYEHLDDEDRAAIAAWNRAFEHEPGARILARPTAAPAEPDRGEHPDFWRPVVTCWLEGTPDRVFVSDSAVFCPTRAAAIEAAAARIRSLGESP